MVLWRIEFKAVGSRTVVPCRYFLMLDGWQRRYDHLEDIVISWITYPNVCIASGKKKRPELKSFFAHRKKGNSSKEQSEIAQDLFEEFGYE